MSKTYRDNGDGAVRTDGGRQYAKPRYRPGSRRRRLNITAHGVPNENPDLQRLGRAIIDAALRQAELEAEASRDGRETRDD